MNVGFGRINTILRSKYPNTEVLDNKNWEWGNSLEILDTFLDERLMSLVHAFLLVLLR